MERLKREEGRSEGGIGGEGSGRENDIYELLVSNELYDQLR